MTLNTPLATVVGIGPKIAKRLERLNLYTVSDLISHFPFRYDDFSKITPVVDAKMGEPVTLQGEIWQIKNSYTKFKKTITRAILNDGSGAIELVWFNQPYLNKTIQSGNRLRVAGAVTSFAGKNTLVAPVWEKTDNALHTGRLVPVYPETALISSRFLRNQIDKLLPLVKSEIIDFLPEDVRGSMLPLAEAIAKIHFPLEMWEAKLARERLAFDELFLIQLATLQTRLSWQQHRSVKPWQIDQEKLNHFISQLPFQLTTAQEKVLGEIVSGLKKDTPMNRLLQGEVGSGKTVVATIAIYLAYLNGFASLLMAPTEILAWQHYETVRKLLEPHGITVGVYTGSRKLVHGSQFMVQGKKSMNNELKRQRTMNADVIIGTHALLSDKLLTDNIGLVIIDEQHRFGVAQRTLLRSRAQVPHFLTMTATPIPRTVALTLYGDLDISIIDELPASRQPIKTYVVPAHKRADADQFIKTQVQQGDQVYIITPLIDESETLQSVKAAKVEYERLTKAVFPKLNLGLLHGRLKATDKERVINQFRDGQINILVSTSVVEVGMDIPNATIMIIEGAERFGLAQLHQLRGRVGRGDKKSYCLLFTTADETAAIPRLKHLEKTFNGLKLAELDLKIRGAGQIFGTLQHGRFDLKLAKLTDLSLIEQARSAAQKLLGISPTLDKYPQLKLKLSELAKAVMPD